MRKLAAVVVVWALTGCTTGLVRSYGVYERKAADTAKSVEAAVQTADLAARAAVERKTFGRYLGQVLGEAADDASSAQGTFDAIQPPDRRADDLRSSLDELLTSAVDSLADVRTTARRAQLGELARQVAGLPGIADKLERFVKEHQ